MAGKAKAKMTEPFPTVATPVKRRIAEKDAPAVKSVESKPARKTASKRSKTIEIDPFAASVETSSTVKKTPAKSVRSSAKTVNAASKPAPAAKTAKKAAKKTIAEPTLDVTAEIAAAGREVELSSAFKLLAAPALPSLARQNRARLQMQTPTRLYFYWSIKENPWAMLRSVFGDDLGSYTLVLKLTDKQTGREDISQTGGEGDYWFDVEPNHTYQAEIGFYAPNRPYFRILHSNTVTTPRRSPSPRAATDADWRVNSAKFAEVLDVAGFSRDAFDVAMAGDDQTAAESTAHYAFSQFLGTTEYAADAITAEDIRYAMLALASGVPLEELKFKISATLFAILQANAGAIEPGKAMSALTEHFHIEETEYNEEQFGAGVYGASLVNFPKTLKTRTQSSKGFSPKSAPRYSPVSSHSLGR